VPIEVSRSPPADISRWPPRTSGVGGRSWCSSGRPLGIPMLEAVGWFLTARSGLWRFFYSSFSIGSSAHPQPVHAACLRRWPLCRSNSPCRSGAVFPWLCPRASPRRSAGLHSRWNRCSRRRRARRFAASRGLQCPGGQHRCWLLKALGFQSGRHCLLRIRSQDLRRPLHACCHSQSPLRATGTNAHDRLGRTLQRRRRPPATERDSTRACGMRRPKRREGFSHHAFLPSPVPSHSRE